MKIATWNINSIRVRLPQIVEWVGHANPDILCLQETKITDDNFPVDDLAQAGYQSVFSGQKTYNGVAILSQSLPQQVVSGIPGFDDPQRRVLAATIAGIRIINVYVPNGESVDSEKYRYKLDWLEQCTGYLDQELRDHPALAVMGDFNIAPEPRDVYDPGLWEGRVLFSRPERAALARMQDLGLSDVFRKFEQPDASYSWWDYRQGGFRRNHGLRIDHILCSAPLSARCGECHIDKNPRGWERPSDHTPVIAHFD